MAFVNNTMIVRRVLMSKLISLFKEEKLVTEIDRVPITMSPKNAHAKGRCCIHKERAVLKYKMELKSSTVWVKNASEQLRSCSTDFYTC